MYYRLWLGSSIRPPRTIPLGPNFQGFDAVTELIPASAKLHKILRRVRLDIDNTPRNYEEIAHAISQHDRVLCIVNTRRDAKEIYKLLPKEGLTLHLSRMMCPDHVSETIHKITEALADDTCKVIRVVATQLVEAGVDIDFPVVYRQEAGLDSVLQAAGRCNREGKKVSVYGKRVQNSVFECVLTEAQFILLKSRLSEIINLSDDSIIFYKLGNNWKRHVERIGKDNSVDVTDTLIL